VKSESQTFSEDFESLRERVIPAASFQQLDAITDHILWRRNDTLRGCGKGCGGSSIAAEGYLQETKGKLAGFAATFGAVIDEIPYNVLSMHRK
jgi:hypothetical protein